MKLISIVMVLLMTSTSFAGVFYNWEVQDDSVAWTSGDIEIDSTITYIIKTGTGTSQVGSIKFFSNAVLTVNKGTFVSATSTGGTYGTIGVTLASAVSGVNGFTVTINGSNGASAIAPINTELFRIVFTASVLADAAMFAPQMYIDATGGSWGSATILGSATVPPAGIDLNLPYNGGMNVTPEPMTVMLLGLGGLFLRRRIA